MIGALRGELAELVPLGDHALEALVDVGGVGYRVLLANREERTLPEIGQTVALFVHTHVREGEITLYGFSERVDRATFELLITAHGVGPALGLAVLCVHTPSSLGAAVGAGDLDALCLVPGIGRKTAQRLAIDLSSHLETLGARSSGADGGAGAKALVEVREALAGLGYGADEVRHATERLSPDGEAEELLREALRELAPQR